MWWKPVYSSNRYIELHTRNSFSNRKQTIHRKRGLGNTGLTKKLKKQDGLEERDIELENIVGNLMIAEYQVNKLRDRVTDKIDARYLHGVSKGVSTYTFKNNGKW